MNSVLLKSIALDVTYRCNFRCLHCFNSSGEHNFDSQELSDEELINIALQIAKLNVETLCFCGGETLLRYETICKAAKEIRKINKNISVNMVSNGYLMTKQKAQGLKEAGLSFIQISLDGAKKESYEWLRNMEGAFDRAINAIKCLVEEGFQVGVAFTPTKVNKDEVADAVKLCAELGVSSFRVQPIMELGRAKNIKDLYLDEKEYFKLSSELKRLTNIYAGKINVEWGDPVIHIVAARTSNLSLNFFTISAYGDIGVSPYLPVSFGNVKRHPIEDYINNGLLDVWKRFEFLRYLTEDINSATALDVSKNNTKLPAIFTGNDYKVDLIDDNNLNEKDLNFKNLIIK